MVDSTNISTLPVDDTVVGDKRLTIDAAGNLVLTNQPFEHQITDAEINEDSATPSLVKGSQLLANDTFDGLSSAVAFVTVYPDKLSALSTVSYRTQAECTTLGIAYPDGGAADYVVEDNDGKTNAEGVWAAGSKQLRLEYEGCVNVATFGVVDTTLNHTDGVLNAIDFAVKNNETEILVSTKDIFIGTTTPEKLLNGKANVFFVGEGSFTDTVTEGSALYRRPVVSKMAPSATIFKDKNLDFTLKKDIVGKVRVVFLGDSLSTSNANALSSTSSKSVVFQQFLKECNPEIDFDFIQRSIGGQNIGDIDGVTTSANVSTHYPWYTDPLRPWLEYVYDVDPHLVILASGTNDNSQLNPNEIISVVSKIEANTDANIVFITNIGAVLSGVADHEGSVFGSYSNQEGRDYAAGWYRSYANKMGYPCIDLNRTFNLVRDGRDLLSTEMFRAIDPLLTDGILHAKSSQACHDFSMQVKVPVGAFSGAKPIEVSMSSKSNNSALLDISGGKIRFRFIDGATPGNFHSQYITDIDEPTGLYEFQCGVKGNEFFFKDITNNGVRGDVITIPVFRFGGLFRPKMQYAGGASGPVQKGSIDRGMPKLYKPTITDIDFWGVVEGSYQDWNIGGGGLNHPSSKGAAAVYMSHYSKQRMKISPRSLVTSDEVDGQFYRTYDDGTADINGRVSMTDALTLVTLPFAVKNAYTKAVATKANGTAGTVSVSPSGSNSTTLALAGFTSSGDSATGFNAVYHIIGVEVL